MAAYEDAENPSETLFWALARAEDRVSRLDERVAASGFAAGWRTRADVRATVAALAVAGRLVHPEDLVLHALGMDARAPDRDIVDARALLAARQKAWSGGAELLSWRGLAWLTGRIAAPPPAGKRPSARVRPAPEAPIPLSDLNLYFQALVAREVQDARGAVEECLAVFDLGGWGGSLLIAAAFLEAWRVADPLPAQRGLGAVLAAQFLRAEGRFGAGLFPLEVALRRRPMPARLAWAALETRLTFWVDAFERAAALELEELARLSGQKAQVERRASAGRRGGKAEAFAALAVAQPVLTTDLISRALQVTPQASGQLVQRFSGVLHEITGRTRYRVWRL